MIELLSTDFVLYALAAGIGLACISGPLGSFVLWRRLSYFGDTLAHSALLGIAIGLLTGSNAQLSILISCLFFAMVLILMERRPGVSTDALLGILAHSTLAMGMVVLALADNVRVNLEAYLFGALLTIGTIDLLWILVVSSAALIVLFIYWNDFLSMTVHAEIAQIEGLNTGRLNLILIMLIALVIAVSMKVVGVLLITSLLIIPPAVARKLSSTPEQMAVLASIVGVTSVVLGLLAAFTWDVPVGPAIVVVATLAYLAVNIYPGIQKP